MPIGGVEKIADERLFENVSNKKLVGILMVIVVVSLIGTSYSVFKDNITGFVTQGTVYIGIKAYTQINVNNNVYFGNSTISNDPLNLTSVSTESHDIGSFNNCTVLNGGVDDPGRDCMGMEVMNNGNVYVNVTMQASKTVQVFFDSVADIGANFSYAVLDGNRTKNQTTVQIMGYSLTDIGLNNASCHPNANNGNIAILPNGSYLNGSYMNWQDIPVSTTALLCSNLSFTTSNNTITVEFNLTIPIDEPVGTKSNTFTFTAYQVE